MPPVNPMVPPINTNAAPGGYQQPNMGSIGVGHPSAGPPGYGGYAAGTGASPAHGGGNQVYAPQRGSAVEVEGAGRSKAQLIVGIDFVGFLFQFTGRPNHANAIIGNNLFWSCFRLRDEYRSKRGHHNRMAWCWQPNETEGKQRVFFFYLEYLATKFSVQGEEV
jgi:hypothetical protein